MQQYEIKRSIRSEISPGRIAEIMRKEFGSAEEHDGHIFSSYGALTKLECWLDGKKVCVDTVGNRNVGDAVAADTVARYNRFLEGVTGYSSKERRKKAMKIR
jgi:hypothetical protein